MSNVIQYYTGGGEKEWSRLDRAPLEFTINMHYIQKYLPEKGNILDNGAGPGKYAMELAKCGYNITLTDLTPSLVELAQIKAKELDLHEKFAAFHVLNATNLEGLPDDYYDAEYFTLKASPSCPFEHHQFAVIASAVFC